MFNKIRGEYGRSSKIKRFPQISKINNTLSEKNHKMRSLKMSLLFTERSKDNPFRQKDPSRFKKSRRSFIELPYYGSRYWYHVRFDASVYDDKYYC